MNRTEELRYDQKILKRAGFTGGFEKIDLGEKEELFCQQCGNKDIILESPAEGYYCPKCGSSDSDE